MPKKGNGKKPGPMFRAYLAEGETGWVELVGVDPPRIRIANIPYSGIYNLDDVVEFSQDQNPKEPLQGKIISRKYPVRTILQYPTKPDFERISKLAKEVGAAMEGAVGPHEGRPGFLVMAAFNENDVIRLVNSLDLPQPPSWQPNEL